MAHKGNNRQIPNVNVRDATGNVDWPLKNTWGRGEEPRVLFQLFNSSAKSDILEMPHSKLTHSWQQYHCSLWESFACLIFFKDFSYANGYDLKSENLNILLHFTKLLIITRKIMYFQLVNTTT
jgi:hypothetical protein